MSTVTMFTDGGCRGNPGGPSSAAAWFPHINAGISEFIPESTNNIAEYQGLLLGLRHSIKQGWLSLQVKADSKLMVNQVNRVWRVNFPHLEILRDEVDLLVDQLTTFSIEYVKRADNAEADRLCNECMDAAVNDDPTGFFK